MKEKEYAEIDVTTTRETAEAVMFDDGDENQRKEKHTESTNRFKSRAAASYRLKDVLKLHHHDRLIDIVPNISSTRQSDLVILEKWKKYFRDLDIPYAVTKRGAFLSLWKERKA